MSAAHPEFIVPAAAGEEPAATPEAAPDGPPPKPPLTLRDPLPPVIESTPALEEVCEAVSSGSGPVALDAERASGYRYSQRAYLVQLRREGSGTALIDPIGFKGLEPLDAAIGDAEWILHAATQDLPCLAEIGLRPRTLFDTELAGRLLNLPRVGLATLVEHFLGYSLAKEHSAADWSTRPLPEPWLVYAALDVEVLVELRERLDAELVAAGKRDWAAQDFEALLSFTGPPERTDPWRRTSGIHRARGRRTLALVRSLWEARDAIASARDTTPGRILPDASILEIASAAPATLNELKGLKALRSRGPRRFISEWHDAVERGLAVPESELPTPSARQEGPPPPRTWADRDPVAAGRLTRSREVVTELSEQHDLPAENLVSPQLVRVLAWEPPADLDIAAVSDVLTRGGARQWQVDLLAARLTEALTD